jgi:hypothetical protein
LESSRSVERERDDVLVFNGIDLTAGGELRIAIDFDTTLVVEVPAVPPVETQA